MGKVLTIKGLRLGSGKPKIIVPLVGETQQSIISQARELTDPRVDMIEWRADYFRPAGPDATRLTEEILSTLAALHEILPDKPLIFTFRSQRDSADLNLAVAGSGWADMVDVEISSQKLDIIPAIQAAGALVIGSCHDFSATPPQEEIVSRLREIRAAGADIAKAAYMPAGPADVLALLNATFEACKQLDCPVITVAMSDIGRLSRIAGGICGSAATFGLKGQGSAPGQMPVEDLARALDMLY